MLLLGALLAGCACATPKTEPPPAPTPTDFPVLSVKGLVLPVADLPAGTKMTQEAPFGLLAFAAYESEDSPAEVEAILRKNGFLSAYFREFEFPDEGPTPLTNLIVVILFDDPSRARSAVNELAEARLQHGGYYEMSLGGKMGDESRAMVGDFGGNTSTGGGPISVADVLFAHSNALVLARTIDDIGTVNHQNAILFAKAELAWLRH